MAMTKSVLVRITQDPELIAMTNLLSHKVLAAWALDEAESLLPYFEAEHPGDLRPRQAIEAGRRWVRGEERMWEARKAAFPCLAAAREATTPSACFAARACSHALATAHVRRHALGAPAYGYKAIAAKDGEIAAEAWLLRVKTRLQELVTKA